MQLLCSPLALVRIVVEQHNDEHFARALSRFQLEQYMQHCLLLFEVVNRLSSRVLQASDSDATRLSMPIQQR